MKGIVSRLKISSFTIRSVPSPSFSKWNSKTNSIVRGRENHRKSDFGSSFRISANRKAWVFCQKLNEIKYLSQGKGNGHCQVQRLGSPDLRTDLLLEITQPGMFSVRKMKNSTLPQNGWQKTNHFVDRHNASFAKPPPILRYFPDFNPLINAPRLPGGFGPAIKGARTIE